MTFQRHVTICISTLPERRESLLATLRTLRHQANTILLWREGATTPDRELSSLGITQVFMGTRIGAVAKLYLASSATTPFVLTCDDDILYPEDYVQTMCHAVVTRQCPVVVHSHTYLGRAHATRQSASAHFKHKHHGGWCNFPGTGTLAWEQGMFNPAFGYTFPNDVDGQLAVQLQRERVPLWCIERHAGWLEPYPQDASVDTVWEQSKRTGHRNKQVLLDMIPHWTLFQPDQTPIETVELR